MAPPGPTADPCIKSVLTWKRQGDSTVDQINFWSYSGGSPNASQLGSLAAVLNGAAMAAFQSLADTFTGGLQTVCTDISVDPVVQGENASAWVGTRAGDVLAPATSAVVNKKPANPYRGGKPKNFLPLGVAGDVATTGLWGSTFVGDVDTAYAAFVAGFVGTAVGSTNIVAEVMVSYYTGGSIVTVSPTTGRARNTPKKRGVNYSTMPPSGTWTPKRLSLGANATSAKVGSQRRRNRNA